MYPIPSDVDIPMSSILMAGTLMHFRAWAYRAVLISPQNCSRAKMRSNSAKYLRLADLTV
jgi:hypothetical protein